MTRWRLGQMLFRNRLCRLCLFFSVLALVTAMVFLGRALPSLLFCLFCFASGCFAAMTIAFQAQEDLNQAWFERNLGVSHEAYMRSLCFTALNLCAAWALLAVAAYALIARDASFGVLLKGLGCAAIPVVMMPFLVFQIDVRRPWLQGIMVVLLGLIIATVWYAHWLGGLVLPLFTYYAAQHCAGRYYRA